MRTEPKQGLPDRKTAGVKKPDEAMDPQEERELTEGVKSTRGVIQTLLQTIKAYRLYDDNHPILTRFLERLKKDFDIYFTEYDSLSLQIGEHRLYYRGKTVYESQDVKESLAFFFFKDGVREIRFHQGLEFKEMTDFLAIVRKGDNVNRMEDDLVTLLWEKDFSRIDFTVVEEFLDGGGVFVPATAEELSRKLEFRGREEMAPQAARKEPPEEPQVVVVENLRQVINPSPGQSLVQACQLNPEEFEELNREVEQEQAPEYVYVVTDSLVEILLHLGEDFDAYENMISFFERLIESLLRQREIGRLVSILKKLNETMEEMVLKDKQIFAIRRILKNAAGANAIGLLGKVLAGGGDAYAEEVRQYLGLMEKEAVEPLCLLLRELESPRWRKMVCERMEVICRDDIQPLIRFVNDPSPFFVCHILYILGRVGHPSTARFLGGLVRHDDTKVREETLGLAAKLGEKGRDLLQKFLKDEESGIRSKAALALAKTVKAAAARPLLETVLTEDFFTRDYEEKASFFRALGETGAPEVIPELKKIARRKRWFFKKAQWEEMRQCAANTLKMMGAEA